MLATATVDREVLVRALRIVAKGISARTRAQVVVSCRSEHLIFQRTGSGIAAEVPAEAAWPGRLCIPASQIAILARHLSPADPVGIQVQPDKCTIGSMTFPATWHARRTGDLIDVDENGDLLTLLRLGRRHSGETIAQSGLTEVMADAERRLASVLQRAGRTLRPVGITEDDLRRILNARLQPPEGS